MQSKQVKDFLEQSIFSLTLINTINIIFDSVKPKLTRSQKVLQMLQM